MANETISTNMSLPIPGVSLTTGTQWATDLNQCLALIDAHTHAAGSGVSITPSGLNINSNLTFNSNSAIDLTKAQFTSQSAALTGTDFISFVGGNLYVNDGSGNQIPITSAGGVAGSPGSIGSLVAPASATYSAGSKLFTWLADSAKSAAMDNGAVTIRETNVASAKGITLASPSSLAADYQLNLPAGLPASTQYLTSTNAGVTSFSTADAIGAAMTSTGANAIAATMTSTGANAIGASMTSTGANAVAASRTRPAGATEPAGGVGYSATANFSTTSVFSTFVDVTNLTVTLTTSGRPVMLGFIPDQSGAPSTAGYIGVSASFYQSEGFVQCLRGATVIGKDSIKVGSPNSTGAWSIMNLPLGSVHYLDVVVAGTYTYKIQACVQSGLGVPTINFVNCVLYAYEL